MSQHLGWFTGLCFQIDLPLYRHHTSTPDSEFGQTRDQARDFLYKRCLLKEVSKETKGVPEKVTAFHWRLWINILDWQLPQSSSIRMNITKIFINKINSNLLSSSNYPLYYNKTPHKSKICYINIQDNKFNKF